MVIGLLPKQGAYDIGLSPHKGLAVEQAHPPETGGVVLRELLLHILGILHTFLHVDVGASGSELAKNIRHTEIRAETLVYTCEDIVNLLLARIVEDVEPILVVAVTAIVAEPIGIVTVDGAEQVVGMLVDGQLHALEFGR